VGTRRRRDNGHGYAIVRLGTPRIIHGIIVDTPYFKGNYPPFVSIEAARLIDHISVISEISCCAMGSNVLVLNRSARVCALRMSGTGVLGQSFAPVVLSTAATAMRLTT
jgi:hypothetical protein